MVTNKNDSLVRMRKLIARRHIYVGRQIKTLSAKVIATPNMEAKEEMLRREGEKQGLCYALKAIDKSCQTEFTFGAKE